MNTFTQRIAVLEALIERYGGDDGEYVADIGGAEPRYWIDGRAVSRQEWMQRAPRGAYVVDIGDEASDALP